jgi:hypothetical protein
MRFRLKSFCGLLGAVAFAGSLAGCHGKPETIYSPPAFGLSTSAPAVKIIVPADGATFHAHADIRLLALATPHGSALEPTIPASKSVPGGNETWEFVQSDGDGYSVEFLADTNSLGTQGAGMVSARVKPEPGKATPFIMPVIGYPSVELVWHDVPAGHYALTARALNQNGQATVSAPVNITVQP